MRKLLITVLSMSMITSGFANEVILKNKSNSPMRITYQYAYKNKNAAPQYGAKQTRILSRQLRLAVVLGRNQYAGVVIEEVSGHKIPSRYRAFPIEMSCQGITQKHRRSETLSFKAPTYPGGTYSCSKGSLA